MHTGFFVPFFYLPRIDVTINLKEDFNVEQQELEAVE